MPPLTAPPRLGRKPKSSTVSRSLWLGIVLGLWLIGLVARLYYLQVIQYPVWVSRAQRQQQRTIDISPKRGTIYDRQMRPLAISLAVDSIFADPSEIPDPGTVCRLLGRTLGVDEKALLARFKGSRSFCWVKRKVSKQEAARVRDLNLRGIYFQSEPKRFYPKARMAAQVLGYVGLDDQGLAGVEYALDEAIRGRPGRVQVITDARRQSIRSSEWQGEPGKDVVLTIDETIQYIAEKALAGAVAQWKAAGGVVMVQNPNTGEILALASAPGFDPNEYARSSSAGWLNRGVSWIYEPGSTFKLITVGAAIEERLTNPREVIDCQNGGIVLAGHLIRDHKAYGHLTVEKVLANSSGVGTIKLGLRLGEDRFYRYVRQFGFGTKTEIELPSEERGLLKPPQRWSGISLGIMSIGHEIGVTPLQVIGAYSAIANGGILFQPRIVRDIFRGSVHQTPVPARGRRVVSERTADMMRKMLAAVVDSGTGLRAQLNGYSSAGKTGTAQKIDASGNYSKSQYVASFVGFAPVGRPAVTILVAIDTPQGAIYGAEVAAPVFRIVAEQVLNYLDIPQDQPSQTLQVARSKVPTDVFRGRLGRPNLLPLDAEAADTVTSTLQPVSWAEIQARSSHQTVMLDEGPRLKVPDFTGASVRKAAAICQEVGIELVVEGSGLAAAQSPPPGTEVSAGTRVVVRFAR